jgi:hypothetical protein
MEVPRSGRNYSPSILQLQRDHDGCTNAGGLPAVSSIPCDADASSNGCPPNDCPSAEATRMDSFSSFDALNSVVHSHTTGSTPRGVFARHTEYDFSEARGAELSRSAPLSTREHPIGHSPQAGPAFPGPWESAHPSPIPPCPAMPNPDATTNAVVPGSSGIESLPLPNPPPEVAALLPTKLYGKMVSPVLARNSPLVPWELPLEIGYFWLGLFKISEVKVIFISAIRFEFIPSLLSLPR